MVLVVGRFQQMLEYMYEKLIGQGKNFEIIDMDFSGDVPWLCMPQKSWEVRPSRSRSDSWS
jgi:hypothetical protein